MTQVSRIPLRKEIEKRVYEVLLESIVSAKTKQQIQQLIDDLLSPTERLMLAKRLSIALLLLKKYDQRTVARWLKVSSTTVNKISLVLQKGTGGYQKVISLILMKEQLKEYLEKIDDTIANILPPPVGRDWSHWRRKRWEAKIQSRKPF
ncbi:hypothetical protein KKB64_04975 [Patescibacteria group bacterium]|nr:hypothetical protein [Patescibacteria group bacterium]